jgi:NTP pyrophosphatase (non-canonical NTP hydrolase)
MELRQLQKKQFVFDNTRGWDKFPASQIFVHLIEELGELGNYILYKEGYKKKGLGHEGIDEKNLEKEFGQVFSLFLQLANNLGINIENAYLSEISNMEKRFDPCKWKKYTKKKTLK